MAVTCDSSARTAFMLSEATPRGRRLRERTFFFEEQTWQIPIPVYLKCHSLEEIEPRYDA